jgi:hypothetical protein
LLSFLFSNLKNVNKNQSSQLAVCRLGGWAALNISIF